MKMNKNLLLGGALASALILGACSANASANDMEWETKNSAGTVNVSEKTEAVSDTTAQEAVDKALQEFEGTITDVDYDKDDGTYYYEIDIKNGDETFEVKINADDLSVIERDLDIDDDKAAAATKDEPKEQSKARETTANESVSLENAFSGTKASEAIEAAQERFDGILEDISYEEDDGVYYYEIKLESAKEEYEVQLRADDLSVMEEEHERDNNERSFRKLEAAHQEKIIAFEEAVKIAEEAVNGEIEDWEYDVHDFKFDFEMRVNGDDTNVEINAKTGDVVEIDD